MEVPDVAETNPKVVEAVLGVVPRWSPTLHLHHATYDIGNL